MSKNEKVCISELSCCECEPNWEEECTRLCFVNKKIRENELNARQTVELLSKIIADKCDELEHFKSDSLYYRNLADGYRKKIYEYENKEKQNGKG